MRTYEQLSGAEGKKIYYRAERFPAGPLFGKLRPCVEIGGEEFDVQDVSMTGLALRAPINRLLANQVGETVDYRMRVGRAVLHEGTARVSRVHRGPENVVIGLGLITDYLDVARLVTKQQDLLVRHDLQKFAQPSDNVDPAYKLIVADVLDMLRRYDGFLAQQRRVTNGVKPIDENDAAEILGLCEERIIPEWRALWRRANELVIPLIDDPEALGSVKLYTERLLTPEFQIGPVCRRAYEKPLGYPGDFLFMNKIYEWEYEGSTLFARLVHRLGLEIGHCVTARMEAMQQTITEIMISEAGGGTARITSVGAGPAQEVQNYLRQQRPPRPVEFTLIDQEKEALAHAYDKIYPLTLASSGAAQVSCLQVSFMEMLKGQGMFAPLAPQDLIYSMGLADYLSPGRARNFVASLYRQLAPGGTLVIGNVKNTVESTFWPMEVICDWSLHYRDEAQMWAMAEGLDTAHAAVKTDSTGQVLLMYLRRP
jgi:hypothetical protein